MIRAAILLAALAPLPALALEVGTDDFRRSSDLMAEGAAPFPTSGVGNAIYGLRMGEDLFLCFIADTPTAQSARQSTLVGAIGGEAVDPAVPNIPVLCVKTE